MVGEMSDDGCITDLVDELRHVLVDRIPWSAHPVHVFVDVVGGRTTPFIP